MVDGGGYGSRLEMVRQCQIEQDNEEEYRSHFEALARNPNRSPVDIVVPIIAVSGFVVHGCRNRFGIVVVAVVRVRR